MIQMNKYWDVMKNISPKWLPLIPGVIAVSWAAIMIRACQAPATAIAFYRMFFSALILLPLAVTIYRNQFKEFSGRTLAITILAGILLGWHFYFWVASLNLTTISASVVLVTTQPVFVAIWARMLLKERIGARGIIAIILAIAGSALIAGCDFGIKKEYLLGDMLALAGAVMAGTYLFIGRVVRPTVSTFPYIFVVYGVSALTLATILAATDNLFAVYTGNDYFYFVLLAIIPTLIGHSLYNYTLKHVAAHKVGISIIGEPIFATIWGILIFTEMPRMTTIAGGLLIIGSLVLVFSQKGQ
jgi:drug/metabolite transporter (DMT)-like permease